jgi:hypothetical protein
MKTADDNTGTPEMKRFFYAALLVISVGPAPAGKAHAQGGAPFERTVSMAKGDRDHAAQADRSEKLPLPRDPDTAVREEFELARARGTAQAWQRFITRHADHRLAAEARAELQKLKQKSSR